MGTVSVPKSARAPFRSSSSAGFVPGRDLQCHEQSEALGFGRLQTQQEHT